MASVPLLTVLLARPTGWSACGSARCVGAVVAMAGIALMSSDALSGDVSALSVLAVVVAAVAAAESGIVLKLLTSAHPVVTNAIGMSVGAVLLLLLSQLSGRPGTCPRARACGRPSAI